MNTGYIFLIAGAAVLIWAVWTYNSFIRSRRLTDEAWSGIAVQLKRRHDLVPNLVETVKGYAAHEKNTLEEIVRLRNSAAETLQAGNGISRLAEAEKALGGALGNIRLIAENYPALQASQNFLALQKNLADIEEQLQFARRYYNGAVREYTILRESFPSLVIGRAFSFPAMEFFALQNAAEAETPKVAL